MAQDNSFCKKNRLNIKGKLLEFDNPKIMGVINVTPDSFYSESRNPKADRALKKAEEMIAEGADIIDIGGYSTRPGAREISLEEERLRVIPVVKALHRQFPESLLSIDTFRSEIAKEAIECGASIVNDVSGGNLDSEMFQMISKLKVPYILMHMRGNPETMKDLNDYKNVVVDVAKEIQQKIVKLRELGVSDIIVDPGFGFAKNIKQNFEMLKNLRHFAIFGVPLLIGISRKSMIYKSLNISPEEALNGTTALNMAALINGADILRVHDVAAAKEVAKLYSLTYS